MPSTQETLDVLAEYRRHGTRNSYDVVKRGEELLKSGQLTNLGDEAWAFLEQVAVAALDCGRLELATVCIERISKQFNDSERVVVLKGMLLEAKDHLEDALKLYESKLSENDSLISVRERLISLHLNHYPISSNPSKTTTSPPFSLQKGIDLLHEHATSVYLSAPAHSQLASVYASLGLYAESRSSLQDIILNSPNDALTVLRIAETDYTMGDWKGAYIGAVRAVEIFASFDHPTGASRRASLLALMSAEKIREAQGSMPKKGKGKSSNVGIKSASLGSWQPQYMDEVVAMGLKRLLNVYSKGWEKDGDKVAGHAESNAMKKLLEEVASSS